MAPRQLRSRAARARVAAHLILGPRPEPFLEALCASISHACDALIVNDNAPDPNVHGPVLQCSSFARRGALMHDRTPFTDFSSARNICLRLHAQHDAGEWAAFVDADEVHDAAVTRIAKNLERVPEDIAFVDGYTWHFFQSFHWYMSVERRMAFFRFTDKLRWEGAVHEKLMGATGARLALPYVYAHYGWVIPARAHAEKGRQYLHLGAPGRVVAQEALHEVAPENYFEFDDRWPHALRFTAAHPPAARATIERIEGERAAEFAKVDRIIRSRQTARQRLQNVLAKGNYELRWRGRAFNPLARSLMS